TITDLTWHTRLLDLLEEGANSYILHLKNKGVENVENIIKQSVLCIHGGGTYKNKKETLKRWQDNFKKLPKNVQNRICLENCEKGYSAQDLLPVCEHLGIPLIFDFHHYDCYPYYHPDEPAQAPIRELLPRILATWKKGSERIPKFHLSDQAPDKRVGAHHDYVENIPKELLELKNVVFHIMIEAKKKELYVLKLQKKNI